jgi:hypothetical protein
MQNTKEHDMQHIKYIAALSALALLAGCGDRPTSKDIGAAVSDSVVDFASGFGQRIDEKMQTEMDIDPTLASNGLQITFGKGRAMGTNQATVYVLADKPFKGSFLFKALDKSGVEIGRAQTDAELKAGDAQYVDVQFPSQMDSSLVRKYHISVRASSAEGA